MMESWDSCGELSFEIFYCYEVNLEINLNENIIYLYVMSKSGSDFVVFPPYKNIMMPLVFNTGQFKLWGDETVKMSVTTIKKLNSF